MFIKWKTASTFNTTYNTMSTKLSNVYCGICKTSTITMASKIRYATGSNSNTVTSLYTQLWFKNMGGIFMKINTNDKSVIHQCKGSGLCTRGWWVYMCGKD